jgi:acetylornithine deacetylase/succinyl-diaminopimelate desuccinylase-like protein
VEESPRAVMLRLIRDRFDGDHWGEKLGLAYRSDLMGRLLVAPTVLGGDARGVSLAVNMRRPDGRTAEQFNAALDAALASIQKAIDPRFQEVEDRYVGDPAVADTSGPLVATLLDVYRAHTGDRESEPISIRGGRYARLFPGAVSFGPALPGDPYRGHAPDEYIELGTLDLLTEMLLDAALRLDAIAAQ